MATVQTAVNESIYSITNWLGVNEAQEGEARLKTGEAAVMRNFRVTAGGALQKRGGTANVAGLMTTYNVNKDTSVESELINSLGLLLEPLSMYPRISANSVGLVVAEGTPENVDTVNWASHVGKYYVYQGAPWALVRVDAAYGAGERVGGGGVTVGERTVFASGGSRYLEGPAIHTGAASLQVYPEAECRDGDVLLAGEPITYEAGTPEAEGWIFENKDGYVKIDGNIWRFYGAKCSDRTPYGKWEKHECGRESHISYYTYYTQGQWEGNGNIYTLPSDGTITGTTSYYFNSGTGQYSGAGSPITVSGGEGGTVYQAQGNVISRTTIWDPGVPPGRASLYTVENSLAQGPFTGTSVYYTYTPGALMDYSLAPENGHPDEDKGLTYVTTTSYEGKTYQIMTDGENFYAYCQAETSETLFTVDWEWYGEPATFDFDEYTFVFNPTISTPNESIDTRVRGIWSGFVEGREVLCAACNGHLWELFYEDGEWSKASCGEIDTTGSVNMFGFDEKLYILDGSEYRVWDGTTLTAVEGYRPLVSVAVSPAGGGTTLEAVNRLTGARRCRFSPDGTAKTFQLPEKGISSVDWVRDINTGTDYDEDQYTVDLEAGTVTFTTAPANATDNLEIAWTNPVSFRSQVSSMRYSELYSGAQNTRVFLYGDGSNKAIYSDLDTDGVPRADYFPDLGEAAVGDSNTPITAMIRHYNRLLCFKLDSAWSISYDTITLADGSVTAGFYVTPVNRDIGNCAPGQAVLVENRPRTLDGRSVIEWKATSTGGNITGDQRNAERISQRVDRTIRTFDLASAVTFYDKITHEYYVIGEDGTALVHNVEADAWYVYTGLNASCMINYKDELYYGTADGYLRHFSQDYKSDNGAAIDALWESGAMSFSQDFRRKYSAMIWVGIKPEDGARLTVTAQTDRKSDFAEYSFSAGGEGAVPEMERIKLKAKKFTYYKLILENNSPDTTATVVSADIRVRGTGYVR